MDEPISVYPCRQSLCVQPKVPAHLRICPRATFTCIDCSRTFDSHSVQVRAGSLTAEFCCKRCGRPAPSAAPRSGRIAHRVVVQVTSRDETLMHLGASFRPAGNPGSKHQDVLQGHNSCVTEVQKYAQGATKPGGVAEGGFYEDGAEPQTIQTAVGTEYLSKKPPWACSICKVSCTSEATLLAHAAGAKHKRRSRAAAGGASGGDGAAKADAGSAAAPREADAQAAAGSAPASSTSPEQVPGDRHLMMGSARALLSLAHHMTSFVALPAVATNGQLATAHSTAGRSRHRSA